MQTITVNLNLSRGSCRINQPLYLGETVTLSFSEAGAYSLILTEPFADSPKDGIVVWAQSTATGELSLNRKALHSAFKKAEALQPNMTISAKCFVISEDEQTVADGEVAIEYSPKAFVIDNTDYPLAREVLLQATSAKDSAISAKDSAISAKDSAIAAKSASEKARDEAHESKTSAEEASSVAEKAAEASSEAREGAITAKNAAKDAQRAAEENALTAVTALEKIIANAKKVVGGVEVLLWNGQGNKPTPIFIPNGIDGVTGYVKCDEDGKYYCLKCKEVDGEMVLALEQVGVDEVTTEGYVRAVNGSTPDATGNVVIPLDFLPIVGGTISGEVKYNTSTVVSRTVNTSYIILNGGKGNEEGARLVAYGKDSQNKGLIYLEAHDGTNRNRLNVFPDGRVVANNKNVVRSVNDTEADDVGNVVIPLNFLPLSGGDMSGNIRFVQVDGIISNKNSAGRIVILGGTSATSGSSLALYNKDNEKGAIFTLRADDGNNTAALSGKPDGTLTWCGKNVILKGDCLPLTGGTITGAIVKSGGSTILSRDTDDGCAQIVGGKNGDRTAYLNLYGADYSSESSRGSFTLAAGNGTKTSRLVGKPDGTLTWDGADLRFQAPKFSSKTTITSGTTYTASTNGFILLDVYAKSKLTVTIATNTYDFQDFDYNSFNTLLPVRKGMAYKVTVTTTSVGGNGYVRHYFVPAM